MQTEEINIFGLVGGLIEQRIKAKITLENKSIVKNLKGSLISFFLCGLKNHFNKTVVYISSNQSFTETIKEDCNLILKNSNASLFIFDTFHNAKMFDVTNQTLRNETIERLLKNEKIILCTDILSVAKGLPEKNQSTKKIIEIVCGAENDFNDFILRLNDLGFERKNFVETIGDYSQRGGIIDVFPFNAELPVRIEFFGDTVESIRSFDVLNQRSQNKLESITITSDFAKSETNASAMIFDYLPSDAIIVFDEEGMLKKELHSFETEGVVFDFNFDKIFNGVGKFPMIENLVLSKSKNEIDFNAVTQKSFSGNLKYFLGDVERLLEKNYKIIFASAGVDEAKRLVDLISDFELFPIDKINFVNESLHNGFILHEDKIALLTEHEIFDRIKRREKRKKFSGLTKQSLKTLQYDDYVVHIDYGIGKFLGLQRIKIRGHEQEVAKIEYADKVNLFVNLNFIDRIQKYSSAEGHAPTLNKIGTGEWKKLQEKAKKKIKDIARDLIKLYAKRKNEIGFAATLDTAWQKELEASFEFDDTPDQARATAEIKIDMESQNPMDRLVCGDVGFGKTEVAVRAAFKSVMSGKQVAVLVPTTILAQQHFNTFKKRLERFSVNVEMISRFKTRGEIKNILADTKNKSVDVLIGTHRILSKDVEFNDLGLLIIDEEQRFGVAAKEKLRSIKINVDTLTLTATPIPRTLQFSLLGARDLSIINTPPKNRLPIHTEVVEFNEKILCEAILHELNRGGQVFIVNDKISTIENLARVIEKHLPQIKFEIAHGQLHGHDLEKIMFDFLNKKFSVLITTKIIESGLDIPSVNTIIINRADRFGMAELHQLRGRVGRSNTQAYAYLMVPQIKTLTRESLNKLESIEEYSELGSGFTLAMRDLEIRGAGNLLGGEQSGFIFEMGFEMYERVLMEAVDELKNEEFADLQKSVPQKNIEAIVEADVDALIPDIYVEDSTERLNIYRRLMCAKFNELDDLKNEMVDRFGEVMPEVENLFLIVKIKLLGSKLWFRKIEIENNILNILLPPNDDKIFYDGGVFQKIMDTVNSELSKTFHLTEKQNKLFLSGALVGFGDEKLNEVYSLLKYFEEKILN